MPRLLTTSTNALQNHVTEDSSPSQAQLNFYQLTFTQTTRQFQTLNEKLTAKMMASFHEAQEDSPGPNRIPESHPAATNSPGEHAQHSIEDLSDWTFAKVVSSASDVASNDDDSDTSFVKVKPATAKNTLAQFTIERLEQTNDQATRQAGSPHVVSTAADTGRHAAAPTEASGNAMNNDVALHEVTNCGVGSDNAYTPEESDYLVLRPTTYTAYRLLKQRSRRRHGVDANDAVVLVPVSKHLANWTVQSRCGKLESLDERPEIICASDARVEAEIYKRLARGAERRRNHMGNEVDWIPWMDALGKWKCIVHA